MTQTLSRRKMDTMMSGLPVSPTTHGVTSIRQMSRPEMRMQDQRGAPGPMSKRYHQRPHGGGAMKTTSNCHQYRRAVVPHRLVFQLYSRNVAALCRPMM